ncbi:S8 family peptidase [Candidatus Microgenomates bacterium]|nr:S8 family peptidase [Candidatus Microgenomates bacterium]
MKKLLIIFAVVVAFFAGTILSSVQAQEIGRAYFKVTSPTALTSISRYIHHDFGDGVFSIEAPISTIERLQTNPNLEFRGMASQWQLLEVPSVASHRETQATCSPSTQTPWGISKVNGGQAGSGSGIKVAVIDTGVKKDHPDLKNNIVDCRDAQYSTILARCSDGNGHGTHVAGTIAANGKILGVAPAAKIMAIKVCSNGGLCWSDDIARGVRYAADNGANIINLSLGGSSITQDEVNAFNYAVGKGVLIVAAAGNSGPADNTILYPAALANVVAVGAINSSDAIANWSSRGNNYNTTPYVVEARDIEFAAPGVSVESTWKNGCYYTISGTSMATPHVAGLSAKVWQGTAAATRTYLQNRALNNYADIGRVGDDPDAGFGLPTAP